MTFGLAQLDMERFLDEGLWKSDVEFRTSSSQSSASLQPNASHGHMCCVALINCATLWKQVSRKTIEVQLKTMSITTVQQVAGSAARPRKGTQPPPLRKLHHHERHSTGVRSKTPSPQSYSTNFQLRLSRPKKGNDLHDCSWQSHLQRPAI